MLRRNSLFPSLAAFVCLALLSVAGQVSAGTVGFVTPADPAVNASVDVADDHGSRADLHRKLCELNRNWWKHTPDFEILTSGDSVDDEVSLIQTHFKLVIQRLRSADVEHLSAAQLEQRLAHIDTLRGYRQAGIFPQNVFVAERCPVFIDPWGTHCAVGYLIAMSGQADLASKINREHRLDLLDDIKTAGLAQWQQDSGLSFDELALIQPTYRSTTLKYPTEIESLILGNSAAIVAAIESGELEVDARCGGKTLLHFASAAGDLALVKLLVGKGADLHAVSQLGCDQAELAKGRSQAVVTVRWNQSTAVTNRGGLGIGLCGPVFQSDRGRIIASLLGDVRGGREGLNALDYATESALPYGSNGYGYVTVNRFVKPVRPGLGRQQVQLNEVVVKLKEDRAAVAAWLKEQGLQSQ